MPGRRPLPAIWFERNEALRQSLGPERRFPPPSTVFADAAARAPGHVETVDEFAQLPAVVAYMDRLQRLTRDLSPRDGDSIQANTVLQMYHTTMWKRYGRRVYVLDHVTCELLANTELPAMPFGEVPIPLPAFYVGLPCGWARFPDRRYEDQALEGFHVVINDEAERGEDLRLVVLHVLGDCGRNDPLADASRGLSFWARAATPLRNVLSVEDWSGATDRSVAERLERVLLGLLLYLHGEHPLVEAVSPPPLRKVEDIRAPARKRAAIEANRRTSRLSYFFVGGERREHAAAVRAASEGSRLRHQVWVTGHWKLQPHGPKGTLRRPQWIRPYLKGPDMSESVQLRVGIVREAQPRS